VEVEPRLPLVRLDFVLFEQVLLNLLDNAVKYSEPGTTITVRGGRETDFVAIEVTDEGVGVPQADLERIFSKFYRVNRTDRQVAGTGLGLSICRGIVEAHRGKIKASIPASGKGTTMTILMPIEEQPAGVDAGRMSRE
jgi:two-component system sensor histidine kinase KdpD